MLPPKAHFGGSAKNSNENSTSGDTVRCRLVAKTTQRVKIFALSSLLCTGRAADEWHWDCKAECTGIRVVEYYLLLSKIITGRLGDSRVRDTITSLYTYYSSEAGRLCRDKSRLSSGPGYGGN